MNLITIRMPFRVKDEEKLKCGFYIVVRVSTKLLIGNVGWHAQYNNTHAPNIPTEIGITST